jgi:hypothetical protein
LEQIRQGLAHGWGSLVDRLRLQALRSRGRRWRGTALYLAVSNWLPTGTGSRAVDRRLGSRPACRYSV